MRRPRCLAAVAALMLAFAAPACALPRLALVPALRVSLAPIIAAPISRIDLFATSLATHDPPRHLDLQDQVQHWLGGRVTFYFGNNLARGDISGVKGFGVKIYFDWL